MTLPVKTMMASTKPQMATASSTGRPMMQNTVKIRPGKTEAQLNHRDLGGLRLEAADAERAEEQLKQGGRGRYVRQRHPGGRIASERRLRVDGVAGVLRDGRVLRRRWLVAVRLLRLLPPGRLWLGVSG